MEKQDIQDVIHVTKSIDELSHRIGLSKDDEKTFIRVENTDKDNEKKCILERGSWDGNEPLFIMGEKNSLHTLLSIESLTKLVDSLKEVQQENFNLKLEKTLWKHIPVDFGDAWAVAMDEIKSITKSSKESKIININLNNLVKKIKKKHPNLFLDMESFSSNGRNLLDDRL